MGIWGRRKEVKRFTVVAQSLENFFIQMKMLLPKRSRGHLKHGLLDWGHFFPAASLECILG